MRPKMAAKNLKLPKFISTEQELEEVMSRPSPELIRDMERLSGDFLILGVAGKMGPTLALMLRRALDAGGLKSNVYGVSRFSEPGVQEKLEKNNIRTLNADVLNEDQIKNLPDAANVIFLVGRKFGSTGAEYLTWATNALAPTFIANRFKRSRIVALSTGNVYPLAPVKMGGCQETDTPGPVGEYAQSGLARERIFEYFSRENKTKTCLIRLNYAIDLRYGVLLDVAKKVFTGQAVPLNTGYANIIWQGDAQEMVLRSLPLCQTPPLVINVTGLETVSIRAIAGQFGKIFGVDPVFEGVASDTALLSNASKAVELFGKPRVSVDQMVAWVGHWVKNKGLEFNKPTHFEVRTGKY